LTVCIIITIISFLVDSRFRHCLITIHPTPLSKSNRSVDQRAIAHLVPDAGDLLGKALRGDKGIERAVSVLNTLLATAGKGEGEDGVVDEHADVLFALLVREALKDDAAREGDLRRNDKPNVSRVQLSRTCEEGSPRGWAWWAGGSPS